MKCNKAQLRLSEYIDGTCSEAENALIEEHIGYCDLCARALSDMKAAVQVFQAMPSIKAPLEFRSKVMARISDRTVAPTNLWIRLTQSLSWRPLVAMGGAAVLVLIVGVSFYSQKPVQTPISDTTFERTTTEVHTDFVSSSPSALEKPKPEAPSAVDMGAM